MKKFSPADLARKILPLVAHILFHSDRPSTGKSTMAKKEGLRPGQRVFVVQCQPEGSVMDWLGTWVLKGKDEGMIWVNGAFPEAWTCDGGKGGRLVIEELDRASAEQTTLLYKLLDDPEIAEYRLPTGEVIRPGPNFQVIATTNGRPNDLPEAIQSRFPAVVEFIEPVPEIIESLPADLREIAQRTAMHDDENRRISLRVWLDYAKHRDAIGNEVAAQVYFQHRAQEILDALAIAKGGKK